MAVEGRRARRRWLAWLILAALPLLLTAAPAVGAAPDRPPVEGPVGRSFDPPEAPWLAGHRGVDLVAEPGTVVVAPGDGIVTFAGPLAGRGVVVVTHGDVRSTLEPVDATVAVGTRVAAGTPVGRLAGGHPCGAAACLHWGLRRGEAYLDPLAGTAARADVRLLHDDAVAAVRRRAEARALEALTAVGPAAGTGLLRRPVDASIGSRFGQRFHPIFREWRLHAGIDLSASCGTPIRAAGDGIVRHAAFDASGGWRLVIDHGTVADGRTLETVYLHAQGYVVRPGQRVSAGQVVGTVGSTGWSTGCHLHFSTKVDGRQVDPERWLG